MKRKERTTYMFLQTNKLAKMCHAEWSKCAKPNVFNCPYCELSPTAKELMFLTNTHPYSVFLINKRDTSHQALLQKLLPGWCNNPEWTWNAERVSALHTRNLFFVGRGSVILYHSQSPILLAIAEEWRKLETPLLDVYDALIADGVQHHFLSLIRDEENKYKQAIMQKSAEHLLANFVSEGSQAYTVFWHKS